MSCNDGMYRTSIVEYSVLVLTHSLIFNFFISFNQRNKNKMKLLKENSIQENLSDYVYVFRYSFRTCQCDTKHSPTISTKIPEHSCRNASRACSSADDRCHCAGARLTSLAILTTSQRIIAFSEKWSDLFVSHKQCRLSCQLAYVNRDNISFCRVGMSLWFAYRTTYHATCN